MNDQFLLSLEAVLVLAVLVLWVIVLRERPILVPILLFGAFGMVIVGATIVSVAPTTPFLPWFAPMGVLVIYYAIHRLYEGWGI